MCSKWDHVKGDIECLPFLLCISGLFVAMGGASCLVYLQKVFLR